MSPRFAPANAQPGQQRPSMGPMMRGTSPQNRMSPFGGQAAQAQTQWNQRPSAALMGGGGMVQVLSIILLGTSQNKLK